MRSKESTTRELARQVVHDTLLSTVTMNPLSFILSLPKSPVDASAILGNVTLEKKQLGANAFHHFVTSSRRTYGVAIGERIRILEMNVWEKEGTGSEAQTVCEIEVSEGRRLVSEMRQT
jgi:hypothetical protein